MDDAWQTQDSANAGISIPTDAALNGNDDASYGAPRSPPRDSAPPRRSSRSRSPARGGGGGGERGSERSRRDDGGNNPGNNLHVSGLSHRVDTRELEAAFAKIGRVQKAQVMYDPHSRESRGFGFVTMESPEEAEAAIAALNATEIMGKVITVEKARRGRARTPTPGRYYGPPKREGHSDRQYDPRPYDSRYARDYDRRPRYDDYPRRDYDRDRGYGGGREYDYPPRRDDYRSRDYDRRY